MDRHARGLGVLHRVRRRRPDDAAACGARRGQHPRAHRQDTLSGARRVNLAPQFAVHRVAILHPMRWLDRLFRPLPSGQQATESDIYYAYRLILKREPDPSGLEHFRRRVRAGLPLPEMVNDFLRSDEFHDRMEAERLSELRRVDLGGYELLVPAADPDFGAMINGYRTYEEPVRQALRDELRRGDVCLDVGANIGVISFL